MKILITFSLIIFSNLLYAQTQELVARDIQSILIKAFKLRLVLKSSTSAKYRITWNGGDLSVKNQLGVLTIISKNYDSIKSFKNVLKKPLITLTITGPSRDLQATIFDSHTSVSRWTNPIFISSAQGKLYGLNNTGSWKLYFKKGLIDLGNHTGSLIVKGFHIKNHIHTGQGSLNFYINEGLIKVKDFEGDISFVTYKAKTFLKHFTGDLKGSSTLGNVNASIKAKKVDLFVKNAITKLYFMGQSPKIKAYTETGKIYAPKNLYKKYSGTSTTVSGRLPGVIKTGSALIKAHSGIVYIN